MKLYLSSFHLGNNPERLASLPSANKKIAVIANSVDNAPTEMRKQLVESEFTDLSRLGLSVEELDLRDYFGKQDELSRKLSEYGAVWVRGGNTFILRRAYAYSGFDKLLKEKITDKAFVYAGYSAGICILSPSLKGLETVDDPNTCPHGYKPEVIWDGLGFINYSIAPHYRSDHPESAAVEKEVEYMIENKILFKALHDGEVLLETL